VTALLGEPTAARRQRMGDGRGMGGSPARGWETAEERASGEAAGAAVRATRLRTAAVGTVARAARRAGGRCRAAGARRLGQRRRTRGGRGGGGAREAGLSGRAARCPDSSFKPRVIARRVAATQQWCAAARARRGARRLTGGARSSAISELKFTPKENSSKNS
jgi:hypothetical protein